MHTLSLRLALSACALLMLIAGSASANRLSRTETSFRITYTPKKFESTTGRTVTCNVTLEGSFHGRTLAKTSGSLVGYITNARFESCTPEHAARSNVETLPWHIQYESFAARTGLPNIESITENLINLSFEITGEIFGFRVTCRYTFASQPLISTREARGVITGQALGNAFHPSSTSGCPEGRLEGANGQVRTPAGSTIAVTLI